MSQVVAGGLQLQVIKAHLMCDAQSSMNTACHVLEELLEASTDEDILAETAVALASDGRRVVWENAEFAVLDTHDGDSDIWHRCVGCICAACAAVLCYRSTQCPASTCRARCCTMITLLRSVHAPVLRTIWARAGSCVRT